MARKRRLSLFVLLRALGYDEEAAPGFLERFVGHFDFLEGQWEKETELAPTREEALVEIYKRARPGEPPSVESARAYFENAFFNPKRYDLTRVGRYKLNRKLGPEIEKIAELFDASTSIRPTQTSSCSARCEILAATTYLLHLAAGEAGYRLDDQDHFANRRIRSVGELIQNQVRIGLSRMERVVRERMTTQDVEAITPQTLINIRPVVAAIKEFFGTSQLSQFMDQTNPLSRPHPQAPPVGARPRRSDPGAGRLRGARRAHQPLRPDVPHRDAGGPEHRPHRLAGHLRPGQRLRLHRDALPQGRRRPVTDEIVYLAADEEEEHVIAQANAPLDDDGALHRRPGARAPRPQGAGVRIGARGTSYGTTSEIDYVPPAEVDLMDVSPKQIVSVATAMIPFLEHDDANRALMGANMQRQAVPLVRAEAPYIGTGIEARAARDAGDVVLAEGDGQVTEVTGDHIRVQYETTRPTARAGPGPQGLPPGQVPPLQPGHLHQPEARWSTRATTVKKGDVLADGPSTHNGDLALGKNLLVAFMPWEGYNFEDAIILSERLVRDDVLTSIHIEAHEVDARDTKLGAEEITRDIPNLSEEILKDLDERGIIRIGAEVGPGDVLVGKVTPKGETELTPEERLLRAIFGEKAREVRDTSLKVPHGETGKVIDVKVFSRDEQHELAPGVNQLVRVYVAQKRKISEGDKLAGRHGNKGVISKILPVEDMPHMADGTPVDIILNPLGVPSRMNVGQVLEAHLGYAARWGWDGDDGNGQPPHSRHRDQDPPDHRAVGLGVDARVRRRPLGRGGSDRAGKHPTIQQILENIHARERATASASSSPTASHALQRPHRRALRQPDHRRLRLHPEAAPPRRRQDPRPVDRPVLDDHPAAAGREGPVRRPAVRRDGGVGPRGLRRRLLPCRSC